MEPLSMINNHPEDALCNSLFHKTPNEIRLHVFSYLSPRDLCNLSLVCRAFRILASHDFLWKFKCPRSLRFSKSKPYTQIYIEWRRNIACREQQIYRMRANRFRNAVQETFLTQRRKFDCMNEPISLDIGIKCSFSGIRGWRRHPTDSANLTITLSVDIDQTAQALCTLLKQASVFKQQYQQSFVLKKMIQRYDRFMQLKASQPASIVLIPTLDIEMVWQTHLLRPEIYRYDCERLYNCFIDHSLLRKTNYNKQQAFMNTCQLYEQRFGEKYCSLTLTCQENNMTENYSYWNETFDEFSSNLLVDFGNRFSFTENDLFLDLNWFDLWKKAKSYKDSIDIDLRRETSGLPKKLYEEFLFLAAKYGIQPGVDFLRIEYSNDLIWHSHMQEPSNYENDCYSLIGCVIHHNPWPVFDDKTKSKLEQMSNELWYLEMNPQKIDDYL